MSNVRPFRKRTSPSDSVAKQSPVKSVRIGEIQLDFADVAHRYKHWARPTAIVVDGPYGLSSFPGDPPTINGLAEWYAPHAAAWSRYSSPETTLWFWGTEVGWATVHPVLELHGWDYRALHIWNKGVAHIAGNVNSKSIRGFPIVTEVCAQYTRKTKLQTADGEMVEMKRWLRLEWQRSGLPLSKTNEACGVKNAATRKYFTQCHLWYIPPPEMFEKLVAYANSRGKPTDRPYFSLDGKTLPTKEQWSRMRAKWNHKHGLTNVWSEPPLHGPERFKGKDARPIHANQKPVRLLEQLIVASTDPRDVVWEPFGGLCSVAVASLRTGRKCFSSEINQDFFELAKSRLHDESSRLFAPAQQN